MSKTGYAKCSNFFVIAFLILFIHFCTSAPINVAENAYSQFIAELNRSKCSVPSQVQLPFNTSQVNNFEYLSSHLEICQNTETTKRNKEAVVLCKEIFDNIRNISCPTKTALPDISVKLSGNVCPDIGALKESVPENDGSLLKRLTDSFLCDIMCDSEFEKACQVLLWSFEVRKQIASVASVQEPEQPNLPEDGGDVNGEEKLSDTMDSFKQGNAVNGNVLPETSINPENGKKNAEEAKDLTEALEHDGIAEVSDPSKLEDNPELKLDAPLISSLKEKQKDPVLSAGENPAIPKTNSQDSTIATKSASGTKTPSLAQERPVVQIPNSNTKEKPVEETGKSESNDQNANKQLQGEVTKHDEVKAGGEVSQGSNTDVAANEQTQNVNVNAVQDKKDTTILSNGLPHDNSDTPAKEKTPVNGEDGIPGNEIPGETPKEVYQDSDLPNDGNDLPHESGNEKSPNDAAADLPNNEQNPSNPVDTFAGNKPQSTVTNANQSGQKTDSPSTGSQTIKETTQQQTVEEVTQDKTSIARVETKENQAQTNPVLTKVDTQDHAKTDTIAHDLIADDKKPKVAQQSEEFDNTIPDAAGGSIIAGEKPLEEGQKINPTSDNPDGMSVSPSSLAETSTKTTVALEKMEGGSDLRQPADQEPDHYGDLENTEDDEYSRPEYGDGGLFEVTKNKASNPDVPSPIYAAKGITSQNERPVDFVSRNSYGQDSSNIQMISSFPDQEDGHFFFYFLSIVLILMAGYLIFHNKQKIIALIVEGRHERNRRSHRVGYKKLETK